MTRSHDAIVLDLDGTLVSDSGALHPRNVAALRAAAEAGVRVMIATGRSSVSAHPILEELSLETPAVVFNGAGLYAHREKRMLEERVLSNRTLRRALALGREKDWMTVLMTSERKLGLHPRDASEEHALSTMHGLVYASRDRLDAEFVVRVTYFSREHGESRRFGEEVEAAIGQPVYVTHFPLSVLAAHRGSPFQVVDVHPPCRGKAEALRYLEDVHGIPARRVVAVGDATNDLPMLEAAGLAVAMGDGMEEAKAVADRILDGCNSDAIAGLVEELFLGTRTARTGA